MADLDLFVLGTVGLNLTKSPLHSGNVGFLRLQNMQIPDVGEGGLEQRGGLTPIHTTALAAPALAIVGVPLSSLFDVTPVGPAGLYVYRISPVDGVTPEWIQYPTSNEGLVAAPAALQVLNPTAGNYTTKIVAGAGIAFVVSGVTAYGLASWDGTTLTAILLDADVPVDPTTSDPMTMLGCLAYDAAGTGTLYVMVSGDGAHVYLCAVDVATGTPTLVETTGVNSGAVATAGWLDATGVYRFAYQSGTDIKVYAIDTTAGSPSWTLETTIDATGFSPADSFLSFAELAGVVYLSACSSGLAAIWKHASGAWSVSASLGTTSTDQVSSLCAFNGNVYAWLHTRGQIWVYDGTGWRLDIDFTIDLSPTMTVVAQLAVFDSQLWVLGEGTLAVPVRTGIGGWSYRFGLSGHAIEALGLSVSA